MGLRRTPHDDALFPITHTMATAASSSVVINIAIVGCGQIVTHHLEAIASLPFRVVALCDPSAERRAVLDTLVATASQQQQQHHHPQQFNTLDDLLLDDDNNNDLLATIGIIFIAVPHDLHESIALQALQATTTTYVVLEKPLAPTHDACDRLVQASHDYNHRLMIAEQSPYWQEIVLARQLIQEQRAIGDTIVSAAAYYYESMRDNITSGSINNNNDDDQQQKSGGGYLGWRGSVARAGGGIALDGGLHWIRPLREICGGRIEQVVGVVRTHLAPELQMEGESLGHALFQFASAAAPDDEDDAAAPSSLRQPPGAGPLIATYSCNMLATAPMAHDTCPYFRITGNQGEIVVHGDGLFKANPGAGGLRLYNEEHPMGKEMFPADRKGGFFLGFTGLWERIAHIIATHDTAAAHETVVRAADDVRVVLALYKSSRTRQWESTTSTTTSDGGAQRH